MFAPVLKVIVAGILGGFLLFAIPFLLFKAFFVFLFIGLLFRLFAGRRWRGRWRHDYRYDHYTDFEQKEGLRDHYNHNPQKI
ncbi:MAG: hypothetical protein ABIN80_15415 [Dyadobacter sp.]|uniref:hypothetical protein n=1 Tax=Dyadobacter sp. TaxID=1914288 RepID=UPI003264095B